MVDREVECTLEWEAAGNPIVFKDAGFPCPPFAVGTSKLSIQRDHELQLQIVAEGILKDISELTRWNAESHAGPVGSFVAPQDITFDVHGSECRLHSFLQNFSRSAADGEPTRFRQTGTVMRMHQRWKQKIVFQDGQAFRIEPLEPPGWRSDWYINGPHAHHFTRSTQRHRVRSFHRSREAGNVNAKEMSPWQIGLDHFVVEAEGLRFAVCRVPDEFAPDWSHPINIEFRSPIPDDATREGGC